MAVFDGSIYAYIGADTKDYEAAMNRIASATQRGFQKAQNAAVNSSNGIVRMVGQIMSQLANNGQSLGQRLGKAFSTGVNLSLGQLQRMASNIGQRLPDPIKAGLQKMAGYVQPAFNKISASLSGFVNKTKMQLSNAFDIGKIRSLFAKLASSTDDLTARISVKLTALAGNFSKTASGLPAPFASAFSKLSSLTLNFENSISRLGARLSNALGGQVLNPALQSWSGFFSSLISKANSTADRISNSFTGKIASSVTRLSTKMTSSLSSGFSTLGSKATSALNGISSKFVSASSAGQKLGSTIKSIISAFSLMAIAKKGIDMVKSALDGAISRVDTMNRFPKTMALFGYSAEQSKSAIDKLSAGIEGLPTPLDSAVKSAQQLSITTGSLDKGVDLALAFNNAMIGYGATTEGAEQALRQFNQSLGSGKIQAEEFNSVSEAAPGLMSKMAESFGFGADGVQELKSALSSGEITAQEFADKMIELNDAQGGFAQMAQTSAGGIRTAFGNLRTAVVKGVADMISKFDEAAKANGLKTIAETLQSFKPAINGAFNTVNALIPNLVAAFARVKEAINVDFSGFTNGVKGAFDLVNRALGEFAKTGQVTQGTIDQIKSKLGEIGPKAIAAWAMLNPATAIATILPLLSGLGKIGILLGGLGAKLAFLALF